MGDSVISIGELWAPSSPPGAAPAIEVVEGGPSPADTNGVEALGGFSMTGGATTKGVAWTGGVGAGGEGGVGVGRAGGEEGATLVLLGTRPSSVASSSSSSCTT